MAGKGRGVILGHILRGVPWLQLLAAGLMTAIFISHYPPPLASQEKLKGWWVHSSGSGRDCCPTVVGFRHRAGSLGESGR